MPKFRKKPGVIEAERFTGDMREPWPQHGVYVDSSSPTGYSMDPPEGPFQVAIGDWIITGINGEKYPCKNDIFEATYDSVEE